MTWEPSDALPKQLVDDFEEGITMEAVMKKHDAVYGHTSTALVVQNSPEQPEPKKAKTDISHIKCAVCHL